MNILNINTLKELFALIICILLVSCGNMPEEIDKPESKLSESELPEDSGKPQSKPENSQSKPESDLPIDTGKSTASTPLLKGEIKDAKHLIQGLTHSAQLANNKFKTDVGIFSVDPTVNKLEKLASNKTYFSDNQDPHYKAYVEKIDNIKKKIKTEENEIAQKKTNLVSYRNKLAAADSAEKVLNLVAEIKREYPSADIDRLYQHLETIAKPRTVSDETAEHRVRFEKNQSLLAKLKALADKFRNHKFINVIDQLIVDRIEFHILIQLNRHDKLDNIEQFTDNFPDFIDRKKILARISGNPFLDSYREFFDNIKALGLDRVTVTPAEITAEKNKSATSASLKELRDRVESYFERYSQEVRKLPAPSTSTLNAALEDLKKAKKPAEVQSNEANFSKIEQVLTKVLENPLKELKALLKDKPSDLDFLTMTQNAKNFVRNLGGIISRVDMTALDDLEGGIAVITPFSYDNATGKFTINKRHIVEEKSSFINGNAALSVFVGMVDKNVESKFSDFINRLDKLDRAH